MIADRKKNTVIFLEAGMKFILLCLKTILFLVVVDRDGGIKTHARGLIKGERFLLGQNKTMYIMCSARMLLTKQLFFFLLLFFLNM